MHQLLVFVLSTLQRPFSSFLKRTDLDTLVTHTRCACMHAKRHTQLTQKMHDHTYLLSAYLHSFLTYGTFYTFFT